MSQQNCRNFGSTSIEAPARFKIKDFADSPDCLIALICEIFDKSLCQLLFEEPKFYSQRPATRWRHHGENQ
ncbi:MAG: hypothetical protein IT327_19940 [Anaerolineae bacterium]|nr:hypothetical protein [Anaerolineae bacterium]